MRISDWSSDVCSSDLHAFLGARYLATVRHGASLSYAPARARVEREPELLELGPSYALYAVLEAVVDTYLQIGRAPCREGVCQYVKISVVPVSLKQNKT